LKKIRITTTLILCFLSAWAFAQKNEDHLIPEDNILHMHEETFLYHSKLRKYLLQDISEWKEITILIKPSFTPESLLCIDFDLKTRKYYLKYNIADKVIYHNDVIKTKKYRREIDKSSIELIEKLIKKALQNTKYQSQESYGMDGVTYSFSTSTKSGRIWSPNESSKMGRLVHIIDNLAVITRKNSTKFNLDYTLKRKIEVLISEI
jgi:hypothetical protein